MHTFHGTAAIDQRFSPAPWFNQIRQAIKHFRHNNVPAELS
jgi:hypothetical protein